MDLNTDAFLERIVGWAKTQADLLAIALVGSYARGSPGPDSDVDLILLTVDPEAYLENQNWISEFGEPAHVVREEWGKVTSLRVFYAHGPEVEYGIAGPEWGSDPGDDGDARVIREGCIALYEIDQHLSRKLSRFGTRGVEQDRHTDH
jgi:hypothetical protein